MYNLKAKLKITFKIKYYYNIFITLQSLNKSVEKLINFKLITNRNTTSTTFNQLGKV